jgi:hypothetical protein
MCANRIADPRPRLDAGLTWLGGGEWRELGERHERSTHVIVGVVVLLGAALAALVAIVALAGSTSWPTAAIVAVGVVFGLLVGAVSRAIASGPTRGWVGIAGRAAVALAVGVVVGELAAVAIFSGPVDRVLDEQAAHRADATPAVAQASAQLDQTRAARTALDDAVARASQHRDEALVVARCEYHPTPDCPQTHITGVPGAGPETRTANDFLGDAQRDLDTAVAGRDRRGPVLDSQIADDERALTQARQTATVDATPGLGARWTAMNDYTLNNPGPLALRLLTIAFFALLSLLPLILTLWRGETSHDRGAFARAERERAELEADTAIAVKRAEVRATIETMWAEQQLASARLAVEAQTEIDREEQRRRVVQASGAPVQVSSERPTEAPQLPAAQDSEPENLPALAEPAGEVELRREGASLIPDVAKAASRWIRPFVPPIIASAIETTTKPLRGARQVFEETEEIQFSLKRTHRVSVQSEESPEPTKHRGSAAARPEPAPVSAGDRQHLMTARDGTPELRGSDGPRQLPPAD